MYYRTR